MLCLNRKRTERIVISDDVVVTVLEIRGGKVRLGIDAPAGLPVHREEVFRRILAARLGPRAVPPPERPEPDPRD